MRKKTDTPKDGNAELDLAAAAANSVFYVLRLYVCGTSRNSLKAIQNLKQVCDTHLAGRYQLSITDIYQQPEQAVIEQIVAAPTLVRQLPLPVRRFIGNLSRRQELLLKLEIEAKDGQDQP
ncbi:MAG: circadian clock KaiB family protein [Candidatus Competibacteraceae bacterium]